jgi:hypothetical protein
MEGEMTYQDGRKVIHRKMTDEEVKCMFNNIRLNTGFSFPDQLIQDFMDGDIVPTFKKCLHFNRDDFRTLIHPILRKRERKRIPKPKTQRQRSKKRKSSTGKKKRNRLKRKKTVSSKNIKESSRS